MASSTERALALALLVATSGCLSGHLLDAARRREVPAALVAVGLDGDDLVVTVRTETVTDFDRPVGRGMTRARVALADLARDLPIESLPVRFEPADALPPGRPLVVLASDAATAPPPLARLVAGDSPALVLETEETGYPPLYLGALTRHRTAPWTWAIMPVAVAFDAVIVPPLILLAPSTMVVGD